MSIYYNKNNTFYYKKRTIKNMLFIQIINYGIISSNIILLLFLCELGKILFLFLSFKE